LTKSSKANTKENSVVSENDVFYVLVIEVIRRRFNADH
jgi:hypothetical protein